MDRLFVLQKSYVEDKYNPDGVMILHLMKQFTGRNLDEYMIVDDDSFQDCVLYNVVNTTFKRAKTFHKKIIPIGTLDFVLMGLKYISGNHNFYMKPIEIPNIFRCREYLGRDYDIKLGQDIDQSIIKDGKHWFLKDASHLKQWNNLFMDGSSEEYITNNTKYVVSSRVDIVSEYRVFVYRGQVLGIMNYQGDVLILPDTVYIQNIVQQYETNTKHPKSYTIDTAIIRDPECMKTVLLEFHPFVSCGLYGFYDKDILNMFEDGIDWYLKQDKEMGKLFV